jgi:hypothetical protein
MVKISPGQINNSRFCQSALDHIKVPSNAILSIVRAIECKSLAVYHNYSYLFGHLLKLLW